MSDEHERQTPHGYSEHFTYGVPKTPVAMVAFALTIAGTGALTLTAYQKAVAGNFGLNPLDIMVSSHETMIATAIGASGMFLSLWIIGFYDYE